MGCRAQCTAIEGCTAALNGAATVAIGQFGTGFFSTLWVDRGVLSNCSAAYAAGASLMYGYGRFNDTVISGCSAFQ
eukprot:7384860-Prymnesium_polylepis.1